MNNKCILSIVLLVAALLSVSRADSSKSDNICETQNDTKLTKWEIYQSPNNSSSIATYKYGSDWICVKFRKSSVYEYTYISAGKSNVEKMKKLADSGNGLNTFINKNVRKRYSKKFTLNGR